MGPEKQGTYETEDYRYALQMNLWGQRCTVIDENGVEQPMQDLRSWTLDPENLLAMNIVDFSLSTANELNSGQGDEAPSQSLSPSASE